MNKSIKRKTLLYKTGVEYGDYTINHIQGCSHGCKYPCYAMMMAKRFWIFALSKTDSLVKREATENMPR